MKYNYDPATGKITYTIAYGEALALLAKRKQINDALANANLQMFFVRVAEVNIVDVREQFLEVSWAIGSVEVLAGVEAES